MDMKERLQELAENARVRIEESEGLDKLNDVRVAYLGKKGELTAILKGMKDVSPEERPKVGQLVNETRAKIETLLEESRRKLEEAVREEKMKAEVIDVTLPAKKSRIGHRHPNSIALEEVERIFIGMGYEVVEGIKKSRGTETVFHRKSAGFFYRIMSRATGFNMENASDFKLLDRKAVESVLSMPERSMFFRATSSWVGFKSTSVLFEVQEREAGESKWSTGSLIRYAFRNIVAFTTLPLQFVTIGAGGCFICSLLLLIYSLVRYFTGHAVEGYTTLLIVMLFIGSAVMMSLGIIGYYIARIYEEVKRRPRYIVSRIIHGGHENEKTDS